jgi:MFS family permease
LTTREDDPAAARRAPAPGAAPPLTPPDGVATHQLAAPGTGATFRDVLAVGEYRALWAAMVLSLVGDQIAVVALTWLVYDTSDSPLLAAATYAISFLPWLVAGPLLSGLADRLPRRELMIACDLVRAGLVLAMLVPGVPLWGLCALLFATELLSPPFTAARAALVPDILPDDRYVLGTAISNVTQMLGQVFGFAAAGILVAALRPSTSLAINAATFLASAAIVGLGIRRRPAARGERAAVRGLFSDAATGLRLVLGRGDLRTLTGFGLLCVFYVVPEGLAVPYARELGGGAAAAGLLLAAAPFGSALGGLAFGRFVAPARRLRLMGPLAVVATGVLVLCATGPSLPLVLAVLTVSGVASAYQLAANAAFVSALPPESRGQAFGIVQAALCAGQGVTVVAAGAAAHFWPPGWVIAVAGALGATAAVWLSLGQRRQVTTA